MRRQWLRQYLRQYRLKRETVFLRYNHNVKKRLSAGLTGSQEWMKEKQSFEQDSVEQAEHGGSSLCVERDDGDDLRPLQKNQYDVYVSSCEEDFSEAREMVSMLESHNLSCFLPERDLKAGPVVDNTARAIMASRRILVLVTVRYLKTRWCEFELQMSVHEMYFSDRAYIVPVLMDNLEQHDTELPPCLKTLSLVDPFNDSNHKEKLMSILKGPERTVRELMPVGFFSHGMAWNYWLLYLKIILPSLASRIDRWCHTESCLDVHMPRRLYILVPTSCHCLGTLTDADPLVTKAASLEPFRRTSAGSEDRSYVSTVWNIQQQDGQCLQFVAEYPAIIDSLYKMECNGSAGLDSQLLKRERKWFLDVLNKVMAKDNLNRYVCIVPYDDTDEEGKLRPLSAILTPIILRDRDPTPSPLPPPLASPPPSPSSSPASPPPSPASCDYL